MFPLPDLSLVYRNIGDYVCGVKLRGPLAPVSVAYEWVKLVHQMADIDTVLLNQRYRGALKPSSYIFEGDHFR